MTRLVIAPLHPTGRQPWERRCGRCGRWRHVLDLVAHVIDPEPERGSGRCRNPRHLRCRGGCA